MLTYKPRTMSEKDATIIIESRHPYGLFFLKEGNVYVGIDNRDGDAWTEEFSTEAACVRWLVEDVPREECGP